MRKNAGIGIMTVLLFTAMLLSPKAVFAGAEEGLLLWFQIVIPTLFPFMLISNLLLNSGGLGIISRVFGRPLGRLFATSRNGAFPVLAGFLCGYPMGAKVTSDLVRARQITKEEGAYLLSFCNNTSPVFIMNFIVWKTLGREDLLVPTLGILMIVPILLSLPFRRYYLGRFRSGSPEHRTLRRFPDLDTDAPSLRNAGSSSLFDSCMMNGFEGIVKVGGYIIFFSILISLIQNIPGEHPVVTALMPSLEITNGILMIHQSVPDIRTSWPLILGLSSFGGFCSVAQTKCMIQGTDLPILPYTVQKLAAALAASFLAYLFMQ